MKSVIDQFVILRFCGGFQLQVNPDFFGHLGMDIFLFQNFQDLQ
jgi:hypothetical protein